MNISLLLYYLLYQTKLVPRWLADWGLAGTAVTIMASSLFMFRVIDLMTSVFMNFPLAVQEMVFAVWQIAKGVNSSQLLPGLQR